MSSTKKANNFDVLHYDINLDFTDFTNQRFSGYTTVTISAEASITEVQLQLEGLTVDSIVHDSQRLNYSRTGIHLDITLAKALKAEEQAKIDIYYNGKPEKDASWGGFYYSGEYAFNLGVAFTSNPHNYGRVWFPMCR